MQKGVARRVPAPEIKGSCATQAGVTGRWVHPPHGNYFTGNRIPNGFIGCHAHTLMATFQSCFKLLKELVFFSVRRASMAQRETRASTGGDMNNHEIRVNQ